MTVLTRDILVEGLRRDVVFEWLANFGVHAEFLKVGFPNLEVLNQDTLSLPFRVAGKAEYSPIDFGRRQVRREK